MTEDNRSEERKLKDPRKLTKRPPSRAAKDGPEHVRVQEHGIRTTARPDVPEEVGSLITELQRENFKENQAEDTKRSEGRTTGAGPNPYKLTGSRASAGEDEIDKLLAGREENELDNSLLSEQAIAAHVASAGESSASDAEVQSVGATDTDTGQKIVEKPERVDAQERAVLERKDDTHASAIKDLQKEDPHADYRVAVAQAEAEAEAGKDDLSADKNPGGIYGGNVQDQSS